jgi:glucokinase
MPQTIGVDLGGTWLRLGLVDTDAKHDEVRHLGAYPSPTTWEGLVELLSRHTSDDIQGYAVAVSGPIDSHATVIRGPNLPWTKRAPALVRSVGQERRRLQRYGSGYRGEVGPRCVTAIHLGDLRYDLHGLGRQLDS